jgi:hypothetical protein
MKIFQIHYQEKPKPAATTLASNGNGGMIWNTKTIAWSGSGPGLPQYILADCMKDALEMAEGIMSEDWEVTGVAVFIADTGILVSPKVSITDFYHVANKK